MIEAGTTGVLIFSVDAVDADGNEEQNVSQVVAIAFEDGAPAARPAEPRWVEARIYWDAGTGEIAFSAPHATVEMGQPTDATRYTWQFAPLTDGVEYRFCVRIATAPWPSGLETLNTDAHPATADADQPAVPTLSVVLV